VSDILERAIELKLDELGIKNIQFNRPYVHEGKCFRCVYRSDYPDLPRTVHRTTQLVRQDGRSGALFAGGEYLTAYQAASARTGSAAPPVAILIRSAVFLSASWDRAFL